VYRSQILQLRGEWPQALTAAGLACERLSQPVHAALGLAAYQRAELLRLRGEFQEAEAVYRQASQYGHEPVPGLALLRSAEGNVEAASATICRAADDSHDPFVRPAVLAAQVEIMLSAGDIGAARGGADQLAVIAREVDAPFLHASAAHAEGSTLLAEGDVAAALAALRRAVVGWRTLEMPYESARSRIQIGLAYRALGDHDSAALEFDSAREVFDRLGARPDMLNVTALAGVGAKPAGPLTGRECEVLRLVAAGNTNREIATQLVLSEHTVARHLQNIFAKLGLSSRAAATAYAYEHGLIDSGG
jgi:ATP/maltotriose-dependent transcriptional regulator MalT